MSAVSAIGLGCAGRVSGGRAPIDAAEAEVRAARAQWNTAVRARDTAAFGALLADTVVQVSPFFVVTGRGPYVALLARLATRRPAFAWEYTPERVAVSTAPGTRVASEVGRWRETWLEDGEATELRGTYYAVWRRSSARWELVREAFTPLTCVGARYCNR